MNTPSESRLDPSSFTRQQLNDINELLNDEDRPALIGREGVRIALPDPVFHHLVRVIRAMRAGKAIILLPEKEAFTTQAAADFLGVSRPFLVSVLERNEIPHHRVGTHRRIYLKDLMAYMQKRDASRRGTLERLSSEIHKAGLYDSELQDAPE